MSGETQGSISGWTVDTLHVWVKTVTDERDRRYEQRFEAQEKATQTAIESARIATNKAEQAIEKRLENTNEWRQAMNDRDVKLLPRIEYDRAHVDLEKRFEEYKKSMDDRISTISSAMLRAEGRGSGLNAGWGYLIGAIGLLAAIFVLIKDINKPPTIQPTMPMQIIPQQTTPIQAVPPKQP